MQNQHSIITIAVDGIGVKLAELYGISDGRMYQILNADNLGKTKLLIRRIALIDKDRARLIKADLDAFFKEILGEDEEKVGAAELHKESFEAVQALLNGEPKEVIKKETVELVRTGQKILAQLDEKEVARIDYTQRQAIDYRG